MGRFSQCTVRNMIQIPLPSALVADLQSVERIVLERVNTQPAVVSVAGHHLSTAYKNLLRATVVLLSAQLGMYDSERVVHVAAAAELIYAATRTHDDLVDEGVRRRTNHAANGEWNHGVTLMVGDYLFALSTGEMALVPDPRIITYYANAVMEICEGELIPVTAISPSEVAFRQYWQRAERKVAIVAAAAKAGITCGGGTPDQIALLQRFGLHLGLALRLREELRDLQGAELPESLQRGIVTLPLLHTAAIVGEDVVRNALDGSDPSALAGLAHLMRSAGIEPTRSELNVQVAAAKATLGVFPESEARQTLRHFVDHVVNE